MRRPLAWSMVVGGAALAVLGIILDWFLLLAGVAFLVVGLNGLRPRAQAPEEPWPSVRPVPPVDEATVRDLPEPITACARCGYLGVRPAQLQEGGLPGISEIASERVCPRCNHRGLPLSFDRREDYAAFLRTLEQSGQGAAGEA